MSSPTKNDLAEAAKNTRNLVSILRQYKSICETRVNGAERVGDRADAEFYAETIREIKHHIAGLTRAVEHCEEQMATAGGNGAAPANDPANIGIMNPNQILEITEVIDRRIASFSHDEKVQVLTAITARYLARNHDS